MTSAAMSLLGMAAALGTTAGILFGLETDSTPPWPVEKEMPDLGPIHLFESDGAGMIPPILHHHFLHLKHRGAKPLL
jgi:hypothetical protein